jgi:hypothetical protein
MNWILQENECLLGIPNFGRKGKMSKVKTFGKSHHDGEFELNRRASVRMHAMVRARVIYFRRFSWIFSAFDILPFRPKLGESAQTLTI